MTGRLAALVDDLVAEPADLDARVASLDDEAWAAPTPAAGWDVRDTINHPPFFDRDALPAVSGPEGFATLVTALGADAAAYVGRPTEEGRADAPAEVPARWRAARAALADALRGLRPGARVTWFGPPTSPASFVTGAGIAQAFAGPPGSGRAPLGGAAR